MSAVKNTAAKETSHSLKVKAAIVLKVLLAVFLLPSWRDKLRVLLVVGWGVGFLCSLVLTFMMGMKFVSPGGVGASIQLLISPPVLVLYIFVIFFPIVRIKFTWNAFFGALGGIALIGSSYILRDCITCTSASFWLLIGGLVLCYYCMWTAFSQK